MMIFHTFLQYQTMRSSELQEALKRARMKTEIEAKNGIEKPKIPNKNEEQSSRHESGESNLAYRAPASPTIEKQSKKPIKAKTPLNLDSGNQFKWL
jgi:hypothetical protein